jgi:RNase P subunit RPR2
VLNDADVWLVPCQTCGHITSKEIGWLKRSTSITCVQCGRAMRFHAHLFSQAIEVLRKGIEIAAGNGVFTDKAP